MSNQPTLTQLYKQPSNQKKVPFKVRKKRTKKKKVTPKAILTDYFKHDQRYVKKLKTSNGISIYTNKRMPQCVCGNMKIKKVMDKDNKNNYGRKYWICYNKYNKKKSCKAFIWDSIFIKKRKTLKNSCL